MKKLLCIAVITVFGFSNICAQSDKGDFTLAPQLGVNLSTYASDASYDTRVSFSGGVVGEYYFNNRWSFRSGLLYDTKGAEDILNNVDKLSYLTIPLNANWHFGKNRNWYLNFGPGVSFLIDANAEVSGMDIDIKDAITGFDFGLMLGIGYKFDVNDNFQIYIDYQGYGGFINVDDNNILPFDIRNSRSSFNIGGVFKV